MVHVRRKIPNSNEIGITINCGQCLIEIAERGEPMPGWLMVGWTELGLQVWCKRHNMNLLHIDFEGCQHPANTTAKGARAITPEQLGKLSELKEKLLREGKNVDGCHEAFFGE